MSSNNKKTKIRHHEHPVYPWVGLFVSMFIILGLAAWYYLSLVDSLDAEVDGAVRSSYTINKTQGNVGENTNLNTINAIDKELLDVASSDFSGSDLTDSSLNISQ